MNTQIETTAKNWWQSSNFWTAAIMVIAGAFVGFEESMAETAVGGIFGIIAVGKSLHNYFKEAKIDWKSWVLDSNFVNYALIVLTTFFANFDAALLEKIQQLFGAALDGDVSGILAAIFSIATILYNVFKQKPKEPVTV